jgi:hypothetical protein
MQTEMSDAEELKRFLLAVAELADAAGDASRRAVEERHGEGYLAAWNTATAMRYLKPLDGEDVIALTTMGRFAADVLG